jgi:hypothetical protein
MTRATNTDGESRTNHRIPSIKAVTAGSTNRCENVPVVVTHGDPDHGSAVTEGTDDRLGVFVNFPGKPDRATHL